MVSVLLCFCASKIYDDDDDDDGVIIIAPNVESRVNCIDL